MITVDPHLKAQFKTQLNNYHNSLRNPVLQNEVDYINRTVTHFSGINLPGVTQSLTTRSAKIHSTPLARFAPCTPAIARLNQAKEIADILLIYKHFTNGNLDAYRGSLVQAKFTKDSLRKRWTHVDSGQYCLLTRWPTFSIVSPFHFFRQYNIHPNAKSWSTYGLVGPNVLTQPIFYSAQRMLNQLGTFPPGASFTFNAQPSKFDSSQSFLMKFIQERLGENLLTNQPIADFVIDLYKVAGLEPDPPGEYEEVSDEKRKKGPFGIVEITSRVEDDR